MRQRIDGEAVVAWKSMLVRGSFPATLFALFAAVGCSSGSGGKNPGSGGSSGTAGNAGTTGVAGNEGGSGVAGNEGGSGVAGNEGGSGVAGSSGNAGTTGGGGSAGPTDAGADHAPIAFEEQILEFARDYISWGRVDDEWRWAPGLCRIPQPGIAHQSMSNDPNTHGQKLYSLFAKNWANYPNGPHDGQVVVKQSWKVEEVTGPDASFKPPITGGAIDADHFYPYAKDPDGGIFHATELAGLYIMFKLDPSTPESDEGWVYATVLPDGKVTSAGRVASCMGCHESSATHERLFGVQKSVAF